MRSTVRAAGGLLWLERDDVVEVALVHRAKHQDWSLPKGKLTSGEHPLAAACREVIEETGVTPVVGARLPSIGYPVLTSSGAADKTVDYWAMRAVAEAPFTATDEVDELRWLPLDDVDAALSYRRDGEVVAAFAKLPRELRTVVLLQHGAPVGDWDGPDVTRPLDMDGETAALRLAELLSWFGPRQVISATARRCVQTVEPLATRLELEITSDSGFDALEHARAPEVTADRLGTLAGREGDGAIVVCCERDVVPDTVALLADSDGVTLPNVRTPDGTGWVLSFAGGVLVAADHLAVDG